MKIIVLHNGGTARTLQLSRRALIAVCVLAVTGVAALGAGLTTTVRGDAVDERVVAQWRARLEQQDKLVDELERKSVAQSTAVGRQLAEMQARLLRMEAIGAHMADAAQLEEGEFDFNNPPAQGGPISGKQQRMDWQTLQDEIAGLANQLRRREAELEILGTVLISEDVKKTSQIKGRPVKWGWLSSNYGKRVDPLTGKTAWHSGVDFAGHDGSDVIAVASGVVTFAGPRQGYGKLVEVSHTNGYVTRYAHHKELDVKTGDVVKKGDTLGKMGSSGRATGPHVHFEVLKDGRSVDPASYVKS